MQPHLQDSSILQPGLNEAVPAWRSACAVGFAAATSVFFAGALHLRYPYMSLVFAMVLATLPRPTIKRLLYRIVALTLGTCCSLLLLVAFPEEPWFYIPLLSIISAIGYALFLKHWGSGAAAAFSFFFLAIHIASVADGFRTDVVIGATELWLQAFIATIVCYFTMFFVPAEKTIPSFPMLSISSILAISIAVGIAALIDASIRTDQGARLIMGSISTIAALEIAQSAHNFHLKIAGYIAGMFLSIAFIISITAMGNDITLYLLALGIVFGLLEWLACRLASWDIFYRSAGMMLAFSVLMLPEPDTSLHIPMQRIMVSFIGCFIAIIVFVTKRESEKYFRRCLQYDCA